MTITIASGERTSPQSFRDVQSITAQTTTTATSEAHGQTLDPNTSVVNILYAASSTEVGTANVLNLDDGLQGQELWINQASATGLAMITLSLATQEFLFTSTATETFTATTALVMGAAVGGRVGLKFIDDSWSFIGTPQGVTPATASSPFA